MYKDKEFVLLKLGGSLITDKSNPYTARNDVIQNLAKQIQHIQSINSDLKIILANGNGSFGHIQALTYGVNKKLQTNYQKKGFCVVQNATIQLNQLVVSELLKVGVSAIGLHPSSMILSKNGVISNFFLDPLYKLLELNIVPVFHGDIICDTINGSQIYSSETILKYIALSLKSKGLTVRKVIFAGVSDGVYDNNGKVISHITKMNINEVNTYMKDTNELDVSGGMKHKVSEALMLAQHNISTLIINGNKAKDSLEKAVLGNKVYGTAID